MKTPAYLALCLALCSVLISAQTNLTDDDAATLISHVKQTPASQLDSALPHVTFERWLLLQVGRGASVAWLVRTADDPSHGLPWVEADISIQGRPGLVIMIGGLSEVGGIAKKPVFRSLELVRADDYAAWPRLRDLPEAVKRARDGAR